LKTGAGLRAMPQHVQGVEGKKGTAPAQCFSEYNRNTKTVLNNVLGVGKLFTDFRFS
jgi:hypothetical protein